MGFPSSAGRWILAALCAAVFSGCSGEPPADSSHPPIIVYLIDALRYDHLGVYGYDRDTSPNLDAFAADAVVFDQAYSPSCWTKPATASLLTGVNPPRHGVQSRRHRVPDELPLIGEYLTAAGYRTRAVVTNPHVSSHWGFGRGFQSFIDTSTDNEQWQGTGADEVNRHLFAFLDEDRGKRFFYYVHTIDPHGPNDPAPPYDRMFTDDPEPVPLPAQLDENTPPETLEMMKALYDAEIYFTDEQFGKLMARLEELGLYDPALIVVVADHGEEHLEHGRGGHGKQLFQELVRIPMLVKFPDNTWAGTRVSGRSSLIDVVPTVLDLLGLQPPDWLEGVDLATLARPGSQPDGDRRELFFDLNQVRHDGTLHVAHAVLSGQFKLIEELLPDQAEWLFDLDQDPHEQVNLIEQQPEQAERLRQRLRAYQTEVSDQAVPEEMREQLRSLGYIN